ncbi:MAG: hypothetical protein ACLGIK_06780, partial [Gemmatimonadota bacterium]
MSVAIIASTDSEVAAAEVELDGRGFPIPLPSRVAWAQALGGRPHRTMIARSARGECLAVAGISVTPTRAFPWHVIA